MSKNRRKKPTSLAASIAPEDIRTGEFVTILNETLEFPAAFLCNAAYSGADDVVRIQLKPSDSGRPMKVIAVCLPFVHVCLPRGKRQTLDVRKVQLVRLTNRYAKTVWRTSKKKSK